MLLASQMQNLFNTLCILNGPRGAMRFHIILCRAARIRNGGDKKFSVVCYEFAAPLTTCPVGTLSPEIVGKLVRCRPESTGQRGASLRELFSQRVADDFGDVARKVGAGLDAFEGCAGMALALIVVLPPAVEGAGDAGGDLGVHGL